MHINFISPQAAQLRCKGKWMVIQEGPVERRTAKGKRYRWKEKSRSIWTHYLQIANRVLYPCATFTAQILTSGRYLSVSTASSTVRRINPRFRTCLFGEMRPPDEQWSQDEGRQEEVDDGDVDDHSVVVVGEGAETNKSYQNLGFQSDNQQFRP